MAEPEDIVSLLATGMPGAAGPAGGAGPEQTPQTLAGKRVLVTSGPTREMLDPIRFISNRSSGRMGAALAAEAAARGARVVLVHGPMGAPAPPGVVTAAVTGARQMLAAVQEHWDGQDYAVFAAAVANYESARPQGHKLKGGEALTLELRRTPDIAAWAGAHRRPGQVLAGFAAESEGLLDYARAKLERKGLDFICANDIGQEGIGFEAEANQVTLLGRDGRQVESPRLAKPALADWIWDQIAAELPEIS